MAAGAKRGKGSVAAMGELAAAGRSRSRSLKVSFVLGCVMEMCSCNGVRKCCALRGSTYVAGEVELFGGVDTIVGGDQGLQRALEGVDLGHDVLQGLEMGEFLVV